MTIFLKLEQISNSILDVITQDAVKTQVEQLSLIVGVWFTLVIMYYGYLTLAGKSEQPIKDLIWKAIGMLIIISFAYNSPTLVSGVSNAVNSIHTWASNSDTSLYAKLDTIYASAIKVGSVMEEFDGTFELTGLFSQFVVLSGFVLVAISSLWIIITTSFFLKVSIMLAPIMIFSKLFSWTKGLFEGWIEIIISNSLTVMLVSIFFNILAVEYEKVITAGIEKASKDGIVTLAFDILLTSLIVIILILMAREIAEKLTKVSIETLGNTVVNKFRKRR